MIKSAFKYCLLLLCLIAMQVQAQDVRSVDVNTLPQSEIEKVKQAIKDANLSPQEAASMARQRGASEQQIMEMQKRLTEESDTSGIRARSANEINRSLIKEEQETLSTRQQPRDSTSLIFGSALFNQKNLTFEPSLNLQTPANYELNIGDQVLISIWGNSQNNYQLEVNKNGQIIVPDVGPVYIAGLRFTDAEKKIRTSLTQIYADMAGDNPGTFAQINMGQLRSIRINIVGEVSTPGTYTLPATATVFNALYLSGGPNKMGSFRNIRLIRNNKTEKEIDIYHFLIDGDASGNISLKDNDIIFIPPIDIHVNLSGEFKRPAIFEMKANESVEDLIRFAGGYTGAAYRAKVQIRRQNQNGPQIIDVPYDAYANTLLMHGDSVSNARIRERFENRVSISGAVYQPGEYEYKAGMTLKDLIVQADSLTKDAFLTRGLISRENADLTRSALPFDVAEVMAGTQNIFLQKEDVVLIQSHFDLKEAQIITVSGEVIKPDTFAWAKDMTLGDAIFLAEGFTEGADSSFIEVARRLNYAESAVLSDKLLHTFTLSMARNLSSETNDADFKLLPYDHVSVRRAPGYRENGKVLITGEVVYAGSFAVSSKNQRISDLIKLAQGVTPQAFIQGATLNRYSTELGSEQVAIELGEILKNPGGPRDLLLRDGDQLYIPEFMETVKVSGWVQNPLSITFEEDRTAKYYIDNTGGFTQNADKKKTYVQYPNGYAARTKNFMGIKKYPKVAPGSQVIVPEKPEKKPGNGNWVAIVSVLSSLALSAATIINVTK